MSCMRQSSCFRSKLFHLSLSIPPHAWNVRTYIHMYPIRNNNKHFIIMNHENTHSKMKLHLIFSYGSYYHHHTTAPLAFLSFWHFYTHGYSVKFFLVRWTNSLASGKVIFHGCLGLPSQKFSCFCSCCLTLQVHEQSKLVNCECNHSTLDIFMYLWSIQKAKDHRCRKFLFRERYFSCFSFLYSVLAAWTVWHELFVDLYGNDEGYNHVLSLESRSVPDCLLWVALVCNMIKSGSQ